MKSNFKILVLVTAVVILNSCAKKLDVFPLNDQTSETIYKDAAGYKSVLAKLYATLSTTGNTGPSGQPDIQSDLNEGSQVGLIRGLFNMQELPTDEAVCAWDDQTIKDFHHLKWDANDPFIKGIYARPIYNITLANEFIRETSDDKLAKRNITGNDAINIKAMKAEVRFIRAFNYWVMIDLFGKSTFITEEDGIGDFKPKEISRVNLFTYIENELKAIEPEMLAAKTAEYGRVDKAANWALQARLYLNAAVYTGTPKWNEAATAAAKIIAAPYSLHNNYAQLFMADNDKRTNELIWTANCDGLRTQSYSNTTFLCKASCGADAADYGVNGGWFGYRATKGLSDLFADASGATDQRALYTTSTFGTSAAQIAIPAIGDFSNGLHVKKYVNKRNDALPVSSPTREFSDVDFPLFRLSEAYLVYAESVARGATTGTATLALDYVNNIRFRAHGGTFGPSNIYKWNAGDLTPQNILNERGRELYWEGHRRTDLVRFNQLTTATYLWPWKGENATGRAVDSKYNLYPIPNVNRTSNSNLSQNNGYIQ